MYTYAMCGNRSCRTGELDKTPLNCPCNEEEQEKVKELYHDEDNKKLAYCSALTEAEGYCRKTRLEEVMDFANKCGYKRLGLAYCSGLQAEAAALTRVFEARGFEVASVVCKVGCTPKEEIGIKEEEKVRIGQFETMCSPITQAMVLNEAATEFNIIMGLCVGHDSLFFKYAEAPTTVFAVKDRVLGHNPLAAIYTLDSYSERLLK